MATIRPGKLNLDVATLLLVSQAMRAFGLTRKTLNNLIASRQLTVVKLPSGRTFVRRAELEALTAKKESR